VNRPHELCRTCGARLDAVLIAHRIDRHPNCWRDPIADDLAHARALRVIASVFPTARRVTLTAPRAAS
jgi:hypothetical protein